jgi:hypothetical protein
MVGFAAGLRGALAGESWTALPSGSSLGETIKQALAKGIPVRASIAEHDVPPEVAWPV